MTAPDDPPRTASDLPPEGDDREVTLRRRIADRWTVLGPAAKTGAIALGAVTAAVAAGLLITLANSRAAAAEADTDSENPDLDEEPPTKPVIKLWTNHDGGYFQCSHMGCKKKVNPYISGHDCCGRCTQASYNDCWEASRRAYDGPGTFPHNYWEGFLKPGVCITCGEPSEAHEVVYDTQRGERR